MRGRIGVVIGLELDNDAADTIDEQRRADQIGRDFEHGTIEKRTAKARGRHGCVDDRGTNSAMSMLGHAR